MPLSTTGSKSGYPDKDHFVSQITPYLFAHQIILAKGQVETSHDLMKDPTDRRRKVTPTCQSGDLALLQIHTLGNAAKGFSIPRENAAQPLN
ncbi:hypothetical protein EVAR_50813_1 [Eumeta japonica]|uniref:Uncharacterized protein n=1 Tax=Eumeta variegata TaxID=151549 RepID=A0A4C1XGV8_EUMVA|nr:hypothetical protein EVAR_50813_1 [Eumeta japonica]